MAITPRKTEIITLKWYLMSLILLGGFGKWKIPMSPWVSILDWLNDLDDLGHPLVNIQKKHQKPWPLELVDFT